MRIDLPQCDFKLCRKCSDGNCIGNENDRADCKEFVNEQIGACADVDKIMEQLEDAYYRIYVKDDIDLGVKRGISLSLTIIKGAIKNGS